MGEAVNERCRSSEEGAGRNHLWPMEARKQIQMQCGGRSGFSYISTCVMVLHNPFWEDGWLYHILLTHYSFWFTFWLLLFASPCLSFLKSQRDSRLCAYAIPYLCGAIHAIACWVKPTKWRRKIFLGRGDIYVTPKTFWEPLKPPNQMEKTTRSKHKSTY